MPTFKKTAVTGPPKPLMMMESHREMKSRRGLSMSPPPSLPVAFDSSLALSLKPRKGTKITH